MRRLFSGLGVVFLVGGAAALSGPNPPAGTFQFEKQGRNPVTHFRWNLEPEDFQFALVSDRTGGHRANIFAQAIAKLNLLQPEFVVSVGDLIEGGKKTDAEYQKEWTVFDGLITKLTMPFFYVAGNHDVEAKEASKFW